MRMAEIPNIDEWQRDIFRVQGCAETTQRTFSVLAELVEKYSTLGFENMEELEKDLRKIQQSAYEICCFADKVTKELRQVGDAVVRMDEFDRIMAEDVFK